MGSGGGRGMDEEHAGVAEAAGATPPQKARCTLDPPHSRAEQNQQVACAQGGRGGRRSERRGERRSLRTWLTRRQTLGESELGRAGRQAAPSGESGISGPKAVCRRDFFLLRGGQSVLGLRLIERGPPTLARNLLYSKSTNLSLRLLEKRPYRNIQNNDRPNVMAHPR